MSMTTTQQTDAYRFFAIAFDAVPGVEYMTQIAEAYDYGMTTQEIVNVYTTKPQFLAVYPAFFTSAQFANALIENVVGASASDAAKAEAKADVEAALASGMTRGDVVYTIFNNLSNLTGDATWGGTAQQMANQVAVAQYATETLLLNTTDLPTLQSVIAGVTNNTDVSTPAAIQALIADALPPAGELTIGTDNINTGLGDDVIIGNSATYNSGDDINGGAGLDTLKLDLISSATPYDVGNVQGVEQLLVRTVESAAEGATDVDLLLTNYEGLETLNIDRSRADITVEDLQGGVDIVINDMRGDVNIQFDQQNVPDEVNVSIREFGQTATGAAGNSDLQDEADTDGAAQDDEADANKANDFGNYAADLTIDAGVATVHLTDAGTEGFENDLSIAGGFTTLNILGGQDDAGMDITIHDVNSSAFAGYGEDGVTVDASTYAGDIAIDADAVNVLNTGVGDDVITTDMSYGGDINAGEGDNRVTIGSLVGDDVWNNDNLDAGGSITTGSGIDVVRIDNASSGAISTGAGNDTVEIGADLGEDSGVSGFRGDLEASGTIDTGAGADVVRVSDDVFGDIDTGSTADGIADGDTVAVGDFVGEDSDITTGAGADIVTIGGDMAGEIDTGSENDRVTVSGDVSGLALDHAEILTGTGDDVVTVTGALLDNSLIDTAEGNDDVTIGNGIQNAQNTVIPPVDSDAFVDLGEGNDELRVTGNVGGDIDAGTGDDDLAIINGSIGATSAIAGGEGHDVLLLETISADDQTISGLATITGVESLVLDDLNGSGADDFTVDLAAFDTALATVAMINSDVIDVTEVNLHNVNGETLIVASQEDTEGTDITLNVTSLQDALTVNLVSANPVDFLNEDDAEGGDVLEANELWHATDYQVAINDISADAEQGVTIADLTLTNDGTADDTVAAEGALVDTVQGRTVILNGTDFDGTLTINGDMAELREGYAESDTRLRTQQDGNVLVVSGIAADTIVAGDYNGDLNLVLANDESHTITLGGGDDVVNLLGDTLDVNDNIDFGAGIDRLIVNEDTQTTGDDSDEVFGDLLSLEELELRGDGGEDLGSNGVLEVSLDDDAFRSDVARVIVAAANGLQGDAANVLLDIGADFYDDVADEGRDLRIDANSGRVVINNDSDNNLDIYTDTGTAGGLVDDGGRDILVDQNGTGTTTVTIGVDAGEDTVDIGAWTEGVEDADYGAGWDDEIELDMLGGTLTSITLLDNHTGSENANVNLTVASNWAGEDDTLTIDASDIADDDLVSETGGVYVDGRLETDAVLHVTGSDNDDEIIGGQLGDNLIGGAGDDIIVGDDKQDRDFQVDTVTFAANYDAGDVVTVSVDGQDYAYTVGIGGETGTVVAAAISALINADLTAIATSVAAGNVLTITGDSLGDEYAVTAGINGTSAVAATPSSITLTFDIVEGGDTDPHETATLVVNGVSYVFTIADHDVNDDHGAVVDAIGATNISYATVSDGIGGADDRLIITFSNVFAAPLNNITAVTVWPGSTQATGIYSIQTNAGSGAPTDQAAPVVENVTPAVTELGGDDTIDGGEGDNNLSGSVGDDDITAGSGNNTISGGVGNDTITVGNGSNTINGDDGDDTITAERPADGSENLLDGNNTVNGGDGNDTITLIAGNDTVDGGAGNDTIDSGAGNDTITGGLGADRLTGGEGSDTFVYNDAAESTGAALAFDTIHGFSAGAGGDVLDLTGISELDALPFNGAVTFLGNFENENVANTAIDVSETDALEVVFVSYGVAGEGYIYADTNQSGGIDSADLAIKVVGITGTFDAANFVLNNVG